MTPTEKFLAEKTNVKLLTEKIDIDEIDIITASKEQPGLFLKAARYRVQKMRKRVRAASYYDTIKTEAALVIRKKDSAKNPKKPMTESHLKELLLQNPDIVDARDALDKAKEEEEIAKLFLAAYEQRQESIQTISRMIGHELSVEKKMGDYKEYADLKKRAKAKYSGTTEDDDDA